MKPAPESIPPWAERAIGAAAAAVFFAGVVSVGLLDSDGPAGAPAVTAPAGAGTTIIERATQAVDQVALPPASLSNRAGRVSNTARGTATSNGSGNTGSANTDSASSAAPESGAPGSDAPATEDPGPVPAETAPPAPSVGVAVGPVAVGASPDGAGANVGDTSVGDPSAAPDQSDGVTVQIDPGVAPPIAVTLP